MVYGYDPSDAEDPWAIHDVTVPDWANDLQTFEVGKGYWILVTEDVTLEIPNQGDAPTVAFTTPMDLSEVTEPTDLLGDVSSPMLDFWRVSSRLIGQTDWQELARGSQPRAGEKLAGFDPTLLLNGLHELKLEAVDSLGRIVEDRISVVVEGRMKLGHFTLSFVDLQIPLSGLDTRILRTYDSRDKRLGDFGVGWTLDIRQGFYQNNRPPGDGWQIPATSGPWGLPCSVVQETKSHLTTVRLSDQEVYRFRLVLKRPSTLIGGCIADAEFEWVDGLLPGTTLEILGNTEVFYPNNSDAVLDRHTQQPFVPDDVKLTTRDGRIFHLDLQDGVTHLEDLHGNTLETTSDGITHSSGRGVEFIRGADGKIEEIIDPRGKRSVYSYDVQNDLIQHTDRSGAETQFSYRDHYLEDIHNAFGIRAVRTEYDEQGRLAQVLYPDGTHTRNIFDAEGRTVASVDQLGRTTRYTYDPVGRLLTTTYPGPDEPGLEKPTVTNEYDRAGRLVKVIDERGNPTRYVYDDAGRRTKVIDALDQETIYIYDDAGRLESVIDPREFTTTYRYDEVGRQRFVISHDQTYFFLARPAQVTEDLIRQHGGDVYYIFEISEVKEMPGCPAEDCIERVLEGVSKYLGLHGFEKEPIFRHNRKSRQWYFYRSSVSWKTDAVRLIMRTGNHTLLSVEVSVFISPELVQSDEDLFDGKYSVDGTSVPFLAGKPDLYYRLPWLRTDGSCNSLSKRIVGDIGSIKDWFDAYATIEQAVALIESGQAVNATPRGLAYRILKRQTAGQ